MIGANVSVGLVLLVLVAGTGGAARAQNPVQWSGNVGQAVDRAKEQSLPLLVWVSGGREDDDDDLDDAQEECFRDPVVVDIIHSRFVPVRVSRTSRVIEEAQRLGLPTAHGLYCAVLTTDGRLLDQMGPGEVADPVAFSAHLDAAFARYCGELYDKELRPLLEDLGAPKPGVRRAAQTVYRLGIRQADGALIGLLARPDLTPSERGRLYSLLASLGTEPCITTLLNRAEEKEAAAALRRAEPGALEWLVPALPGEEGPVAARQMAAYRTVIQVCRVPAPKAEDWWAGAAPDARRKELDRVKAKAETVLEYWRQRRGGAR